ncbi:MAG: hypothetical protein ACKPKO_44940 [Candidatus Fonsibacter sp.]
MNSLPAEKVRCGRIVGKTRIKVEQITNNKVGESAAQTIANELMVRHIVDYIIPIK